MGACLDLIHGMRGDLVGVAVLIELLALQGRDKLNLGDRLHAVLQV
jgi:adenine/guanine phosphoribosyltransferase-like PRPP-binding protein